MRTRNGRLRRRGLHRRRRSPSQLRALGGEGRYRWPWNTGSWRHDRRHHGRRHHGRRHHGRRHHDRRHHGRRHHGRRHHGRRHHDRRHHGGGGYGRGNRRRSWRWGGMRAGGRRMDRRRCTRWFRLKRGDRPQIIGFGGGGQRAGIDIAHDAQHGIGLVLGRERAEPQPVTRAPVFHALNLVHVRCAGGKERFRGLAERGAGRAQVDHEGPRAAQAR